MKSNLAIEILEREEAYLDKALPPLEIKQFEKEIPFQQTVWIAQQEVGYLSRSDQTRFIGSPYFRNCSLVCAWNPHTLQTVLFHVSNKTDVFDVTRRIQEFFDGTSLLIWMAGGCAHGVKQDIHQGRRYNWVLAEMLYSFASNHTQIRFHYRRPNIRTPGLLNDKSYLFDRTRGELFEINNAMVARKELEYAEVFGPEFTARFNAANLYPYFAQGALPCVVAYRNEEYTARRPIEIPRVKRALAQMKREYIDLLGEKFCQEIALVKKPQAVFGLLEEEFIALLKKYFPSNKYLLDRCREEESMALFMQELLLTYWGCMDEHPILS